MLNMSIETAQGLGSEPGLHHLDEKLERNLACVFVRLHETVRRSEQDGAESQNLKELHFNPRLMKADGFA